ncbi:MarR family transcriptional regulator [Bacillus safensis]|uniref:MarR family winged helix-turn-helix transcriptional regulator n=1 Tax=Bacillus safensis TaxID=561879 RepID=UPI0022378BCF|nr:MarR family transcriptional regulator [Bacillus safensis]MCW4642367.1 MarR family transcriptional regulator [Bacillus safensis]MCY7564685.1 MarR family transcriptional regulator [Bacillus safensis]MCY7624156.1 MarR family transcriptional regulator [Bacillus safensis]MCY7633936.1 MarR family transcriptional regulator [Bacillus safensis]MCY7648493.1 MarR family transcriptional regulator [Bacillus safensis]
MDTLNRECLHQIHQGARLLSKKANEALAAYDLYMSQWTVLFCLDAFGPKTQKDIWTYLNVEAPTITRTVTRLEANGWVKRVQGKDKRENLIVMTDDAKARFEEIKRTMEQFEEECLSDFTYEEKQLLHTLLHKLSTE